MKSLPFNVRPMPIGTHRSWDETYVKCCVDFIKPDINWDCISTLTSAVLDARVPSSGGIYMFVRADVFGGLFPKITFPQVVYVGRAKNLHSRLGDYLADKRAVELKGSRKRNVRPQIERMFISFRDGLQVYFFECPESKQVVYEDILIKLLDPIFNETQKYSFEIPESDYVIAGFVDKTEPAYTGPSVEASASISMSAKLSDAQPAF